MKPSKKHACSFALRLLILFSASLACSSSKKTSSSSGGTQTDSACASLTSPASLTGLLLNDNTRQFFDAAQKRVQDLIPSSIDVILDESSFIEGGGAQHVNFNFFLSGVSLCQFQARVHRLEDQTYIKGRLPNDITIHDPLPTPITRDSSDTDRILSQLNIKNPIDHIVDKNCLAWEDNTFVSALELDFTIQDLPYYALITKNKILKLEPRFFDVITEQSRIYVKEPTNSTALVLKTFTLSNMSDGGSLCSARFKMNLPSTIQQAFATASKFFFETTDPRFKETSLFTNVTTHADWFLSLKILSAWPGPKIDLLMDGTNNFLNNSSVYLPMTNATVPTIKIGAGDGTNLQNLYIDFDVVAHELGHHIVYRTLKTTTGESLVLHEGLADAFVYGNTRDPCLGRLICPSGSTICYSAQCLRTGQFPLKFGDSGLPTEAHRLSQVISSLVWDIGNGNTTNGITGIGVEDMMKILLKSVDFFASDAGYSDFIESLMKADKTLNNSKNCSTIEDAAYARGLKETLTNAGVSCSTVK